MIIGEADDDQRTHIAQQGNQETTHRMTGD